MKKKLIMLGVFISLSTTAIFADSLTLPYDSVWSYGSAIQGSGARKVWSNLISDQKTHSTAAKIDNKSKSSGRVAKKKWSYASSYGSLWSRGYSYYYFY